MNKEYAEEVAGRIIEQLRQGTAPWQKPWQPGELRLPYNAATGKEYRGMNTIWLHMQGYGDPRWMTYKQAEAAGAQVRKGSRGTRIIYWKFHDEQPMKDEQGRPVLDGDGNPRKIRVELERPRVFTAVVFNAEQIEGLPALEAKPMGPEPERHARAEAILANSGAQIGHVAGDRAFYRPSTDSITLPERQQFGSADAYYATALHELGHWTGHESRLDRDLSHPFGSEGYAREELRAEIASLMLGERLEIGHDPGQHAAYVASWIKVLEDDPREIFRAAADAEKINSYVLAFELEQQRTQQAEVGERSDFSYRDILTPEVMASLQGSVDAAEQAGALYPTIDAGRIVSDFAATLTPEQLRNFDPELAGEPLFEMLEEMALEAGLELPPPEQMQIRFTRPAPQAEAAEPPVDPQQLRDEANRRELHALQRSQHDLTVQENDREVGENFRRILREVADRGGDEGRRAGAALERFGDAYPEIGGDRHWQTIGFDIRTGTGTASPSENLPPIVNAAALRALSGGARPELTDPAPAAVEVGQRVRFTPNEERAAQGGMTIEGVAVDIARTQAGNLRYRIRTDEIAPQDGQPQEWLVYTNHGRIEQLPARDVAAGPTPEAEAALQAAHRDAVPTYSPLETWQNLDATARELGLVAAVRLIDDADAETYRAPFQVSYAQMDGTPTSITTGIFMDGKALTGANGERVSPFISEDHESQSSDLRTALTRERDERPTVQHTPPEASTMTPQRTYLIVPYRQKDEAKKLAQDAGFRLQWDKEAKQWFAPEGVDVKQTGLARWLPENTKVEVERPPSPEVSFAAAIRAAGLELDGAPVMDGKFHRAVVKGDKGAEASGSYSGHLEGRIPGGIINNFRTGERINWKYEGKVEGISAEDRERLNREAVERAERRAVEIAAQHGAMAKIAQAVWDEAPPATADHPYCAAKGITQPGEHGLRMVPGDVSDEAKAAGVRIAKNWREAKAMREAEPEARVFIAGDLLVPARDGEGKLWSVQSVNPHFKGFMKDARKAGLYTVAGADPSDFAAALERDPSTPLVLAEGYATADTVARLRGHPVVAAFDSGNLDAVARELRERWPDRPLLFAADNDHNAEKQIRPNGKPGVNVGLKKAQEAAATHKGGALVPSFRDGDKGSDWNDYAQQHGDEAARKELERQVAQAKTEAAMNAERMMSLARERESEARDDPTTTADDAIVAQERAAAHDLMARAVAGSTEVRAEATDALVANATGAGRPMAAVAATLDRTNAENADEIKEQRQAILDGHNVSSESERYGAWHVERRAGDHRPTDRIVNGAEWWDDKRMLLQESNEDPRDLERALAALGPCPPEGERIRINEHGSRVVERQAVAQDTAKAARPRAKGQGAEL